MVTAQVLNAFYRDLRALDMPEGLVQGLVIAAATVLIADHFMVTDENCITPAQWNPDSC